jgi:methyl-accepting chemotaxis protein
VITPLLSTKQTEPIMKMSMALALAMVLFLGLPQVQAGDAVTAMLDPYFRIQSALSDDRTDGVKDDALAIKAAATSLGDSGAKIAAAADALSTAAPDIAAARTAFSTLSDAVVAYSEQTKAAGDEVHAMYCPMANKQWLQKGEKVSNPYYGKAMLSCGEKKKKSS